jgi:hypothetical protein
MLMIVAQIEDIIDSRIRNIIHNMDLFSEAKHLHKQLEPIAKAEAFLVQYLFGLG